MQNLPQQLGPFLTSLQRTADDWGVQLNLVRHFFFCNFTCRSVVCAVTIGADWRLIVEFAVTLWQVDSASAIADKQDKFHPRSEAQSQKEIKPKHSNSEADCAKVKSKTKLPLGPASHRLPSFPSTHSDLCISSI